MSSLRDLRWMSVDAFTSGFHRCGDNLNILGSAQLCWHPDRNEMPSLAKIFENGFACTVQGIDSASGVASQSNPGERNPIAAPAPSAPADTAPP